MDEAAYEASCDCSEIGTSLFLSLLILFTSGFQAFTVCKQGCICEFLLFLLSNPISCFVELYCVL